MGEKLVSVVIPLYNRGEYIEEAIDSLLCQTYENIEIIVVDDCSTDDGISVVESYRDDRIKIVRNEVNSGTAATRNRGFQEAKGEYVALLDSDDIALPDRIEKQVRYLEENKDIYLVGGNRLNFTSDREIGRSKHSTDSEELKVSLLFDMDFTNPAIMMRSIVTREFSQDSHFKVGQDYDYIYRVSKKYRVSNLEDIVIKYRLHGEQASQNTRYDKYHRVIKTRVFDELEINIDDRDKDIYYKGISLKANPEELERFTEIILEILLKNKKLFIYNDTILRERLLGKLERIIKRRLKGIEGLRYQKKVRGLLKANRIAIDSHSMRILINSIKPNK